MAKFYDSGTIAVAAEVLSNRRMQYINCFYFSSPSLLWLYIYMLLLFLGDIVTMVCRMSCHVCVSIATSSRTISQLHACVSVLICLKQWHVITLL